MGINEFLANKPSVYEMVITVITSSISITLFYASSDRITASLFTVKDDPLISVITRFLKASASTQREIFTEYRLKLHNLSAPHKFWPLYFTALLQCIQTLPLHLTWEENESWRGEYLKKGSTQNVDPSRLKYTFLKRGNSAARQ